MLPVILGNVLGIIARVAIGLGIAFILSKTVPSMPNKLLRFVFLFALWIPFNFIINYVNVRLLGYHKIGWTAALIMALLFAALFTFFPMESDTTKSA